MERADVVSLVNSLREAFLAAGADVREKPTVTGGAFLVDGRALGRVDVRVSTVRVRLWLPERERRSFEARPTFDPESGWLHVVSEEDVTFTRGLIDLAYRASSERDPVKPSAPRAAAEPARRATQTVAGRASPPATSAERASPEKKKRAAPAAPLRTKRTRG